METRTILAESVEMQIVIKHNVVDGTLSVTGCDKNAVVALGMLDWALARVRRFITMNDIAQDAKNAPRVSLAGGIPQ